MILVNVKAQTNASKLRRETRNDREVIIVPSATLPDDVVMNGIMYPAEEIERAYPQLERSPAPLGHPTVNGLFVSARDPEGINVGWVGAWNENVRRENGRVFLDKVIDVSRAQESEGGRRLLDAIASAEAEGGAIHTSTGIYLEREAAPEGSGYDWIAHNLMMDHDAILLDEPGAATPDQGVGLMVNSAGKPERIEVISSEVDYAIQGIKEAINYAIDRKERAEKARKNEGVVNKVLAYLSELLGSTEEAAGLTVNSQNGDDKMTVTKEEFDALAAKVDKLVANAEQQPDLAGVVAEAMKPVTERLEQLQANEKAREDEERAELVEVVTNAALLDKEDAEELTTNALRKLAEKAKPKGAAPLNGSFHANGSQDEWEGYDMNSHLEGK